MSGFLTRDAYISAKSGRTSPFTRDIWVVFRVFSGDGMAAKGTVKTSPFPLHLAHSIEIHRTKITVRLCCSRRHIWRYTPGRRNSRFFWFSRPASFRLILDICRNLSCSYSCRTCPIAPRIFAVLFAFFPSGMASLLLLLEQAFQQRQNSARQTRI